MLESLIFDVYGLFLQFHLLLFLIWETYETFYQLKVAKDPYHMP